MNPNQQKEEFSRAYVQAIAAVAGFDVYTPCVDDDSIDLGIAASGLRSRSRPRLELQLKCTAKATAEVVRFPLKLKNYDNLRCRCWVPRLLVVVCVPEHQKKWVTETKEQLVLHARALWVSLADMPVTTNTASVTVELPPEHYFSVRELCRLMDLIDRTGQI